MEQSLFFQYVQRYFPQLVLSITERLNGKDATMALTYLYRNLLTPRYSVDGRWETLTGEYTRVAADVVAMDSSLPLKKRDSLTKATGDIPKVGMELYLNEKQLSDLDAMIAQNIDVNQIVAAIFEDTPKVITGVYERLELMFLQGLSTGVALIEPGATDGDNVGTGVRVDYGFLPANQFGVAIPWAGNPTTATPLNDIKRMMDKIRLDGRNVSVCYTDPVTVDALLATDQVKQLYAFQVGFVGGNIPAPSLEQANAAIRARYGFTIQVVDRSIRTERDSVQSTVRPWKEGMLTFAPSGPIGALTWTRLAEMNHPVQNVAYQTTDSFLLVSKYRTNRPSLREYTASQARVVPVITNVDRIYQIDSKTVQA